MKKLLIISERTRYHFQKPLRYFKKIEVVHLTKYVFEDLEVTDNKLKKYSSVFDLYRKLKEENPDIIQSLEPYYGYSRFKIPLKVLPIIFCIQLYCLIYRKKYFFHVLENVPAKNKYGWAWPIMKLIAKSYAKQASIIYYLNQGARRNLEELRAKKIRQGLWGIWGIDIKQFVPAKKTGKSILFIGELVERKGFDDFLHIAANINNKLPKVIVGGGPMESEAVKAMKSNNNISYLGVVKSQRIPGILKDAYLLVFPSKTTAYSAEQVGMVCIEAMGCGIPIVGYKTGSINEFVPEKASFLVEEGRKDLLEKKIRYLIDNPALREKMSKYARIYATKRYNASKNVPILEKHILQSFSMSLKKTS